METKFVPWRCETLKRDWDPSDCVLCTLPEGADRDRLILARGDHSYLAVNASPYNRGHLLVVLFDHTDELDALPPEVAAEHYQLIQTAISALRAVYDPDGFNVGANIGLGSGGSIADHLHTHVVPRWENDTDFFPVTAGTSLVESALDETYDAVLDALRASPRTEEADTSGRTLMFQ